MKEYDYIFGMNYIEQFRRALFLTAPNGENVVGAVNHANIKQYEKGAFGELLRWDRTIEGELVWAGRYAAWEIFKVLSEL